MRALREAYLRIKGDPTRHERQPELGRKSGVELSLGNEVFLDDDLVRGYSGRSGDLGRPFQDALRHAMLAQESNLGRKDARGRDRRSGALTLDRQGR